MLVQPCANRGSRTRIRSWDVVKNIDFHLDRLICGVPFRERDERKTASTWCTLLLKRSSSALHLCPEGGRGIGGLDAEKYHLVDRTSKRFLEMMGMIYLFTKWMNALGCRPRFCIHALSGMFLKALSYEGKIINFVLFSIILWSQCTDS